MDLPYQTSHGQSTDSNNALGKLRVTEKGTDSLADSHMPAHWQVIPNSFLKTERSSTAPKIHLTDSRMYLLLVCSLYLHVIRSTFKSTWGKSPKRQVRDWTEKLAYWILSVSQIEHLGPLDTSHLGKIYTAWKFTITLLVPWKLCTLQLKYQSLSFGYTT